MMDAADWFRWTGGVLQIVGVLEVALEVHAARRGLGLPGLFKQLFRRMRAEQTTPVSAPFRTAWNVHSKPAVEMVSESVLTVGAQVDRVRQELDELTQRVVRMEHDLRGEVRQVETQSVMEDYRIREAVRRVEALLGGGHWLRVGAVISLVSGVAFTTWPDGCATAWRLLSARA